MKKVLAIFMVVLLIIQAGAVTVFAEAQEDSKKVITISDIDFSALSDIDTSTVIETLGIPSNAIEIVCEDWSSPEEIVISGNDIEITNGKYSYKLTLRANGTLTFDNDLEIYYQGINGKYQLNYEIEETDNHIMNVTGTFENIIIESPLLEKLSDENKDWILTHISEDTYFYQLLLRTSEGFDFTNRLIFLLDNEPVGYNINYTYDLETDEQSLVINGIKDFSEPEPEIPAAVAEDTAISEEIEAANKIEEETAVAENKAAEQVSEQSADESIIVESNGVAEQTANKAVINNPNRTVKQTSKQAVNKFEIKNAQRFVKAGRTTLGARVLNYGKGTKSYKIKEVNNKKYADYFTINRFTGNIKVNPRTPKGKYVVTVQGKAGMAMNCAAGDWQTADVTIVVV